MPYYRVKVRNPNNGKSYTMSVKAPTEAKAKEIAKRKARGDE